MRRVWLLLLGVLLLACALFFGTAHSGPVRVADIADGPILPPGGGNG